MKFRYTPRCSAGGPSSAGDKVAPIATPISKPHFTTAPVTWQGLVPAVLVREPRETARLQPTAKSPEPSCSHPLTMTKECREKPKSGLLVSREYHLLVQRVAIISFSGGNSRKGLRMNFRGPEGLDVAVAKERGGEIVVFFLGAIWSRAKDFPFSTSHFADSASARSSVSAIVSQLGATPVKTFAAPSLPEPVAPLLRLQAGREYFRNRMHNRSHVSDHLYVRGKEPLQ